MRATFLFLSLLLPVSAFASAEVRVHVSGVPLKYAADTVVFVSGPTLPAAKPQTVTMDQKGLKFLPRVLAIAVGDSVRFLNNDSVVHNVFSSDVESYVLPPFKQGESASHTFTKPGLYSQLCSFHPDMLAYVFVGPSAAHAVVDERGQAVVSALPPGDYKLTVWNAHLPPTEKAVTVGSGPLKVEVSLAAPVHN